MLDNSPTSSTQVPALKEILRQLEGKLSALAQERIALESRASSSLSWMVVVLVSALSATSFFVLSAEKIPSILKQVEIPLGSIEGGFLCAIIYLSRSLSRNKTWHMVGSVSHLSTDSEQEVLSRTVGCYERYVSRNEASLNLLQRKISFATRTASDCLALGAFLLVVVLSINVFQEWKHPKQVPPAPVATSPS